MYIYVLLSAALLTALLIFRVKIRLIIYEGLRVEITFTLFTLELSDFSEGSDKNKRHTLSFYRRIAATIIELIEKSDVELERLKVPKESGVDYSNTEYTSPYRYHIAISALIAYIKGKARKLYIKDNAVTLISDRDEKLSFILSIRSSPFYVAKAIMTILVESRRNRRKTEAENVRN